MPRRVNHGFNLATVAQIGLIPILSVAFYFITTWATTGDRLAQHDTAIRTLIANSQSNKEEEDKAREKTRAEFMSYQQKTTEILGKLDTRLAVSETKQETANQSLQKIVDELARINSVSRR